MKVLLTILIIFSLPTFVLADNVEIINNVSVSASTGGNKVSNGETIESASKSSVEVYTEVDGEVIEDFKKETQGGEEINYEAEKKFEGGSVETKIEAKTASTTKTPETFLGSSEEKRIATSSLIATSGSTSRLNLDTPKTFEGFRAKVKQILKYVFSFFKFK